MERDIGILPSGMTFSMLHSWLIGELGLRPYRVAQLFRWIHARDATSFGEMTDLGKELRDRLSGLASITVPVEIERLESTDGTLKILLSLDDGLVVEAVLIPEEKRLTACLSTQVGCRMGCTFCRTGSIGFRRNLGADEVVSQLYHLRRIAGRRITNAVLMGMGEPFDNIGAVGTALDILTDDNGACLGSRKITLSTIGIPEKIREFSAMKGQYGLALSLHSAVQQTRESLIPVAGAFPLPDLKKELIAYTEEKKRRVTLEYCLIRDVNDSLEEASALALFAADLPCKLNIIAFNRIEGLALEPPPAEVITRFVEYLYPRCPAVMLRKSRGADIAAACGQLGSSLLSGNGSSNRGNRIRCGEPGEKQSL